MTDIIEVADKIGLLNCIDDCYLERGDYIEQLQAFADHYRKEGAAELEKVRGQRDGAYVDAANHLDKRREAEEQLAATELVVEQMRADFKEVLRISDRKHDAWDKAKQALQLQPSLSALREKVKEGRKNRDSVVQCKTCKYNITEYEIVYCHSCCHVASELRAKGEQ